MAAAPSSTSLKFVSALSDHHDAITAAERACDGALASLQSASAGDPDLVLAFVSHHHADLMGAIGDVLHRRLNPGTLLAVSAEAVIGDAPAPGSQDENSAIDASGGAPEGTSGGEKDRSAGEKGGASGSSAPTRAGPTELEGKPGISLLAARLPQAGASMNGGAGSSGVTVRAFTSEDLPFLEENDPMIGDKIAAAIGATSDLRAILLFADPFSVPVVRLLPAISRMCRETLGLKRTPVLGGMASAGDKPGSNGLVINKRLSRTGAIGVTLSGDIRVDTLVSQGCKPFGPTYVVTGGKHNVLLSLSGRPALQALHEAIETIPAEDRNQLEKGVFLGRVVNEYKDRFGRDDFLIRNVLGVDQSRKALAVADMLRVGQTVRFHLRDAVAADEDLALLLAAQRLKSPALGALLFTCNGRGTRLFEQPNHDVGLLAAALTPEGEPGAGPPPIAGFFAAGEIGPVGGEAFLHGQTASVAVFRERFSPDIED